MDDTQFFIFCTLRIFRPAKALVTPTGRQTASAPGLSVALLQWQSGRTQQTLAALQIKSGQTPIFSEGFKLGIIAEGAVLLTYRSFQHGDDGGVTRCTLRSSIWLLSANDNGGRWQMRFHQVMLSHNQ